MLLKYKRKYISVDKPFDDIEISNFSVFTGKNGSGKTHLLRAIKEGCLTVDDFSQKNILYLSYLDFRHNFQTRTNHSNKNNAWKRLQTPQENNNLIGGLIEFEELVDPFRKDIENICVHKDIPIFDLRVEDIQNDKASEMISGIQKYKNAILNLLEDQTYLEDEIVQSIHDSVIRKSKVFLSNIDEENFNLLYQKTAISNKKIVSDLSNIFLEYYRNIAKNDLNKSRGKGFLTEEQFNQKFGLPPWELIRNIFLGFKLNFDINDPEEENIDSFDGNFEIAFKHTSKNNKTVLFDELSSGEQILITLVNTIYTVNQKDGLPKLILLDEIDGPLNPSIIGKCITYLIDNFVSNGIKLILATHSPTTVAFAPENSIYAIDTNDQTPVKPVDSREGISILSEGFITLSDILELEKIKESKIIISEGKNYIYLNKAKEIFAKTDDLRVLELNIGGSGQLRTLFNFMRTFNVSKQFIFVFDNDYNLREKRDENQGLIKDPDGETEYEPRDLEEIKITTNKNNKFYIFNENRDSDSARGIENLFSKNVTSSFPGVFDKKGPKNKQRLEKYILDRNVNEDFNSFKPLFDFITDTINHNL